MTTRHQQLFIVVFLTLLFSTTFVLAQASKNEKPKTNLDDALNYPRTELSMPGKYPAKVVKITNENSVVNDSIVYEAAYSMIEDGMLKLTGKETIKDAYRLFFNDNEKIGLKVNPVAGQILSTSVEVTKAIVTQLNESGIPSRNIIIWDRREEQLKEAGFTEENFPGVTIIGTERLGENGTMYDADSNLYSLQMIDTSWYYWADCEQEYDAETLPYMVNEGKYSYFTKIITQMCDKVINVPILKNAGSSITLCMKNLAYGVTTNTARLHKKLWSETTAQVCAFPPIRDKVVLNIVDGLKGCFNGGPGANPQFFTNYKTILVGTDAVAVDRIGYEIVLKKRIEEGIQKEDNPRGRIFMDLGEEYGLGTADLNKIELIINESK